ncbi:nuclear pore complex protein Nup133 [Striga asiatica]|uniref:Nuclear pore complex protein Nup133 n=1 Tax=Striga asiatica TaxID=4170 RepID=A0A5A7PNU2_STRAF|nr:nuclear pore complex protein Nup133 [Striga asiatica]
MLNGRRVRSESETFSMRKRVDLTVDNVAEDDTGGAAMIGVPTTKPRTSPPATGGPATGNGNLGPNGRADQPQGSKTRGIETGTYLRLQLPTGRRPRPPSSPAAANQISESKFRQKNPPALLQTIARSRP